MRYLIIIAILAMAGCAESGSSGSSGGTVIIIPGDTLGPAMPTDLDIEMVSVSACAPDHVADALMRLTWIDNADNETGYLVKCGTSGYELPDQTLGPDVTEAECYPITIDSSDSAGFGVAAVNDNGVSAMIGMNFQSDELAGLCP